eukprot:8329771-Pyramimonas_sp.AAC.1
MGRCLAVAVGGDFGGWFGLNGSLLGCGGGWRLRGLVWFEWVAAWLWRWDAQVQRSVVTDGDASDTDLYSMEMFLEALDEEQRAMTEEFKDEIVSVCRQSERTLLVSPAPVCFRKRPDT